MNTEDTPAPCYLELFAIVAAGAGHILTELFLSPSLARIYNGAVVVGFLAYLIWRVVRHQQILREWGMRRDNFNSALRAQLMFGLPAAAVIWGFAWWIGSASPPVTFWVSFSLYPLWGIAQQFAVQNLIARNLKRAVTRPVALALVTAVLFSVSHFPNVQLMALVLIAGFGFTLIYLRHPNIWAVGIVHGALGALAYYLILQEDPGAMIWKCLKRLWL